MTYTFGGWFVSPSLDAATKFTFAGKTMPASNMVLFGKWIPPVHTVKYYLTPDAGGPSGTVSNIPHGTPVAASALGYTVPTGMTPADFIAWYWYVGGAFVAYDFARPVTDSSVVLYPVWRDKAYTITYDANGGTGAVPEDSTQYAAGAQAVIRGPGGLSKAGQVFLGCNTQASGGGSAYYPNDKLSIAADMTLYAQWGDIPVATSITYHRNSGEASDVPITESLLNNATHTIKSGDTFTRTGYAFLGWNTKANGSGTAYQPGEQVLITADTDNNLYAQWKAATVNVVATKVWDGGHSVNHIKVILELYRRIGSGTPVKVTDAPSVTPDTGTSETFVYTWANQPISDGNNTYTYSVKEVTTSLPSGYTSVVTGSGYNFTVTNTYHNIGNVEAYKYWYTDGVVPQLPDVWFQLYRYTSANPTPELVPKQNIKYMPGGTFHWKLPNMILKDPDGNDYIYIVKEVDASGNDFVPAGYEKEESTTSAKVTNYRYGKERTVNVLKDWTNVPSDKKTAIEVTLFKNGDKLVQTGVTNPVTLNAENGWTYTWTGLDNYYNTTTLNNYTVQENTDNLAQGVVYEGTGYVHTDIAKGYLTTATIKNRALATGSLDISALVTKKLDGRPLQAGEFKFALLKGTDIIQNNVANEASGKIPFAPLTFTEDQIGQTFSYTIKEIIPNPAADGMSYDASSKTFAVKVEAGTSGQLKLTTTGPDNPVFTNTYTATGEYDIDTELNPNKVLTGRVLADQEFSFELRKGDELVDTKKNTADGNIPFGKLSFTQDDIGKSYTYTIKEIAGTEAGMAYDLMTLSFSIKVEDAGEGKLTLTVSKPDDVTFNNTYTATGEYDIDTELNPNKVLTGRELADQEFTFELLRGDEIIQTAKNTADGNIPFGKLSFTQADIGETYNYTIKEIPGTEAGMAYDPMTLSFSIQVADAGQGELALTVERPENVTFNNTFTPQTMDIAIDKQWADNNNAAGQRPASIQVQLMQNGVPVGGPDTISAANGWTMTRINLPIRDANNTPYIYTVREVTVPTNYLPTYQGLMSGRLVIVNTYETPPAPPQPPIVPGPGPVVPAPEVPPAAGLASGNLGETFE